MGKINDTLNDFTNMPEVFADLCNGIFYGGKKAVTPENLAEYRCVMLHIGSLKSKKEHYRKTKGGTLNMCKAFEDWSKEERIKGEKIGSKRGEQKAFTLMSKLIQDNRLEEARRAADNAALRKKLYLEYGI